RRRHTRCLSDWSSDVCSSDLELALQLLERKFGRNLSEGDRPRFVLDPEYSVESYLSYQGARFNDRFDANTYLYMLKAMDYWDLQIGRASCRERVEYAVCCE